MAQFSNQSDHWVEGPRELSASVLYDVRGNKTEVTGSISVGKTIYIYDAQGNKTEEVLYSSDGSLSSKIVHTYDAQGKRTETVSSASGRFRRPSLNKTLYTYDGQGHLSRQIFCDAAGCMDQASYSYDPQGNLIEEVYYYPGGGIKLHLEHAYDGQGQRTETTSEDAHGSALGIDKVVTTYDTHGNILEITSYFTHKVGDEEDRLIPPPTKFVYTYEFDAHGNWIKQSQSHCFSSVESAKPVCEPSMVTYRTITYYSEAGAQQP